MGRFSIYSFFHERLRITFWVFLKHTHVVWKKKNVFLFMRERECQGWWLSYVAVTFWTDLRIYTYFSLRPVERWMEHVYIGREHWENVTFFKKRKPPKCVAQQFSTPYSQPPLSKHNKGISLRHAKRPRYLFIQILDSMQRRYPIAETWIYWMLIRKANNKALALAPYHQLS